MACKSVSIYTFYSWLGMQTLVKIIYLKLKSKTEIKFQEHILFYELV